MENLENIKKKAAYISLFVGIGMFVGKFGAYLLTDSAAIFSDAAESVVHILATSMALYSIILSSKPADPSHLYGHSNIEDFSAIVEGLLIVTAAIVIIYTAAFDLIYGPDPQKLGIGIVIISAAGVINLILGFYLIRKGKSTNSLALVADGKHVLTDSYTSIGVLIGLIMVMITGVKILDPVFAIIIALNILYTGFTLVRESVGNLMNETDPELLKLITDKLNLIRKNYWIDLHHLRFWKSADKVFIDFHLSLPYYFTIKESHKEEDDIANELKTVLPNSQVRIHMDYCDAELCKYCDYVACNERGEMKSKNVKWNVEKMLGEPILPKTHIT